MLKKKTPGPIGAIALAVVVLLVAMAGSATAGALITGKDIKDGSVTSRDLRNGAVTGKDVRDGSLSRQDFTGSLQGPQGPAGPEGPVGPQGPQGVQGASGYEQRVVGVVIPRRTVGHQDAYCPAGKVAAGGGVSSTAPINAKVVESAPLNGSAGWTAGIYNVSFDEALTAYVWAICVYAS